MALVILVDDDAHQRTLWAEALAEEGHEVVTAGCGPEAISLMRDIRPDAVILDVSMPGMDGLEALAKIQQLDSEVPIILHTAYGNLLQEYPSWAADAFLVKQADPEKLLATIADLTTPRLS
jgi:CheY-like chemotaxis protein